MEIRFYLYKEINMNQHRINRKIANEKKGGNVNI